MQKDIEEEEEEVLVNFVWTEEAHEVMIAGNFLNKWESRKKMEKTNGAFRCSYVDS